MRALLLVVLLTGCSAMGQPSVIPSAGVYSVESLVLVDSYREVASLCGTQALACHQTFPDGSVRLVFNRHAVDQHCAHELKHLTDGCFHYDPNPNSSCWSPDNEQ